LVIKAAGEQEYNATMRELTAGLVVVTLRAVFGIAGLMIWIFPE
jgi:hypothetical protein